MVSRLRELLVRPPSDADASEAVPARDTAGALPEGTTAGPGPRDVGRLRRERRRLLRARETHVRDLGGLALEMFRRRRLKPDLLERRASDVLSIEATVYEVDEALTSALAASPAPTIGSARACSCGESIPEGARFCPACGLAVAGEDPLNTCAQCTASIPAGASFCGTCGATAGGGDSEARAGW